MFCNKYLPPGFCSIGCCATWLQKKHNWCTRRNGWVGSAAGRTRWCEVEPPWNGNQSQSRFILHDKCLFICAQTARMAPPPWERGRASYPFQRLPGWAGPGAAAPLGGRRRTQVPAGGWAGTRGDGRPHRALARRRACQSRRLPRCAGQGRRSDAGCLRSGWAHGGRGCGGGGGAGAPARAPSCPPARPGARCTRRPATTAARAPGPCPVRAHAPSSDAWRPAPRPAAPGLPGRAPAGAAAHRAPSDRRHARLVHGRACLGERWEGAVRCAPQGAAARARRLAACPCRPQPPWPRAAAARSCASGGTPPPWTPAPWAAPPACRASGRTKSTRAPGRRSPRCAAWGPASASC
mmetsp:Transcript_6204/g.15977  ORF Transcript_6204/g.15977 Transcript_6204/m.15977 type:complete len:351 (+) Transcript_6204:1266-2318(+)